MRYRDVLYERYQSAVTDQSLTDNVYFRSLDDSAKEWAEFIVDNNEYSENSRLKANEEIAKGYDIKKVVKDFYSIYEVD